MASILNAPITPLYTDFNLFADPISKAIETRRARETAEAQKQKTIDDLITTQQPVPALPPGAISEEGAISGDGSDQSGDNSFSAVIQSQLKRIAEIDEDRASQVGNLVRSGNIEGIQAVNEDLTQSVERISRVQGKQGRAAKIAELNSIMQEDIASGELTDEDRAEYIELANLSEDELDLRLAREKMLAEQTIEVTGSTIQEATRQQEAQQQQQQALIAQSGFTPDQVAAAARVAANSNNPAEAFKKLLVPKEQQETFSILNDSTGRPVAQRNNLTGQLSALPSGFDAKGLTNIKVDDQGNFFGVNDKNQVEQLQFTEGSSPFIPKEGDNTSLSVGADGSIQFSTGSDAAPLNSDIQGLTNPNKTKEQDKLISNRETLANLAQINSLFKPEFLTFGSKFQNLINSGRAKMDPNSLSEVERKNLTEFSEFRKTSTRQLNAVLNQLSGAAISPEEATRLIAGLPNAGTGLFDGDDAITFKAGLDSIIKQTKLGIARASLNLGYGVPLEDVPSFISKKAEEIGNRIAQENPDLDEASIEKIATAELRSIVGF